MSEHAEQPLESSGLNVQSTERITLSGSDQVWRVEAGYLDIFRTPVENGAIAGMRQHVTRLESGQVAFGLPASENDPFIVMAVGSNGAVLRDMTRDQLQASGEAAASIAGWVADLLVALTPSAPPPGTRTIAAFEEVSLDTHHTVSAQEVVWIELQDGHLVYPSSDDFAPYPVTGLMPVSEHSWLACHEPATVRAMDSAELFDQYAWLPLDQFHDFALARFAQLHAQYIQDEQTRMAARTVLNQRALSGALSQVLAVTGMAEEALPTLGTTSQADQLLAALRVVGRVSHIDLVKTPPASNGDAAAVEHLRRLADASGVRMRQITLQGEWWEQESSACLGFRRDSGVPCALVASSRGRYRLYDAGTGQYKNVDAACAATLEPTAFVLYRPLPQGHLTWRDLLRYLRDTVSGDIHRLLLAAATSALIGLLIPLATGVLFSDVIPNAEIPFLIELTAALVLAAIGKAAFELTRAIAVLRMEGKANAALQAAIWDRLLRLPTTFFRRYTAGDLAMRAMGVDTIRQVLSGVTVTAAISGAFSLVNFGMMFYYDGRLTAVAVGLLIVFLGLTTILNLRQLQVQRQAYETEGKVAGLLLQLLNGIAKLRVANVEARAFNVWAKLFATQRSLLFQGRSITNGITVINSIFPIFSSMALFAYVAWKLEALSIGEFLAFNAAYGQFLASTLAMGAAFTSSLVIRPLYERLTPILQTLPEVNDVKHDPGALVGQIEINNVSFRYNSEGPLILEDISVSVEPGEFVAFVGPSGSGKSTLFRLLLGFEMPEAGSIFYDGKDLAGLELRAVRKQLGVVLQKGALMPGSIFDNIVGSEPLSQDDAWEAARLAGLEDDLQTMPMGMQTMVSEGATTLSGGQRQRLLIARALVRRPRLILFDEATSALDNRTQEIISQSLDRFNATRIVIAHRLSTIQNADRICVIEAGRLVQQGTFDDLMAVDGPFATLARRQLV